MSFALFDAASGGSPVWGETQTVNVGADGVYSILLGAGTPDGLPNSIFRKGGASWLELHCTDNNPSSVLNDCTQQYPLGQRTLLPMVRYAFAAKDADMLGGRLPAEYLTRSDAGNAITNRMQAVISDATNGLAKRAQTGGSTGSLPVWIDNSTLDNSIIAQLGTSIGIGTVSPQSTLDVNGAATIRGNLGLVSSTLPNGGSSDSPGLQLTAQNLSGNSKIPVAQSFIWQVQPQGTGSESPSSVLALLYSNGTNQPTSTGFSISPTGTISFAAGQTFPSEVGTSSTSQSQQGINQSTGYLVMGSSSAASGNAGPAAALKANQFPGSDVGVQINECLSAVETQGGGVCDASQLATGAAIAFTSVSITVGDGVNPVKLQLPNSAIVFRAGAGLHYRANVEIAGANEGATAIGCDVLNQGYCVQNDNLNNQVVSNVFLHDFEIIGLQNDPSTAAGSAGLALGANHVDVLQSKFERLNIGGFGIGTFVDGPGGCTCYNTFRDVSSSGFSYGLFIQNSGGWPFGVNSNKWFGGQMWGAVGIFLSGDGKNTFWHPDIEGATKHGIVFNGTEDSVYSPYEEADGCDLLNGFENEISGPLAGGGAYTPCAESQDSTDFWFGPDAAPNTLGVRQAILFGSSGMYDYNAMSKIQADGWGLDVLYGNGAQNIYGMTGYAPLNAGHIGASSGITAQGQTSFAAIQNPGPPALQATGGSGTSYTYYVIGYDSSGGSTLPSSPVVVSGPATLGSIISASQSAAGQGYVVGDTVTVVGGDGKGTLQITSIGAGGAVTGLSVFSGGTQYAALDDGNGFVPNVFAVTGGLGTGLAVTLTSSMLTITVAGVSGLVCQDVLKGDIQHVLSYSPMIDAACGNYSTVPTKHDFGQALIGVIPGTRNTTGDVTISGVLKSAGSVAAKGDLQGFSSVPARIPVGSDGTTLIADSTQPTGVKWASSPQGFSAGGDLSGTSTQQTVVAIQSHPIPSPSVAGYLHWNQSSWDYVPDGYTGTCRGSDALNIQKGLVVSCTPSPDFSLQTSSPDVSAQVAVIAENSLNIQSIGGFEGLVYLTCLAPSGISCNLNSSASVSSGSFATAGLTLSIAESITAQTFAVQIVGTSSSGITHTIVMPVTVTPPSINTPGISLTNNANGPIALSGVGGSSKAAVSVLGTGGFSGIVGLSCTVLAATGSSSGPTCSLSQQSIVAGAQPAVVTLTVLDPSLAATHTQIAKTARCILSGVICVLLPRKRRKPHFPRFFAAVLMVILCSGLCGCQISSIVGTSHSKPEPVNSQSYTVTVSGVSGSMSGATSIAVVVN
jgi:hypothetical protein